MSAATECSGKFEAGVLFGEAEAFLAEGMFPQASELYRKALHVCPADYLAEAHLACCLDYSGHQTEATEHYLRAFQLLPSCLGAASDTDRTYTNVLVSPEVLQIGAPVMKALKPNTAAAAYARGWYAEHTGDDQQAARDFELCTALEPNFAQADRELVDLAQGGLVNPAIADRAEVTLLRLSVSGDTGPDFDFDFVHDLKAAAKEVGPCFEPGPAGRGSLLPQYLFQNSVWGYLSSAGDLGNMIGAYRTKRIDGGKGDYPGEGD